MGRGSNERNGTIMQRRAVVGGAGGFIGHHMVRYLKDKGYWVRGVDIKEPEYEATAADEFLVLDLREWENCLKATEGVEEVYQLAADMGGIGYITGNRVEIARNNVLINAHMLEAAFQNGVQRHFYSSSACIYPMYKQHDPDVTPLKEEDAYPADPEEGYGWEKLYSEKLCQYYQEEGSSRRGRALPQHLRPLGTLRAGARRPRGDQPQGRAADDGADIEIWATVSRPAVHLHRRLRRGHLPHRAERPLGAAEPRPTGSSIDQLVDPVSEVAGKTLVKQHDLTKPQGVRGRNSDNDLCKATLGWAPEVTLEDGLKSTYAWIEDQLEAAGRLPMSANA
jgi:nucleoside-diphosphate-sugar epimerase